MDPTEARARFAASRVAHLATADGDGRPHLVVMCFAVEHHVVYSAVDAKPKATMSLKRLQNIAANPAVAVLVDHYDDVNWDRLWWARGDGSGRVLEPDTPPAIHACELLRARYPQYRDEPPEGPVIAIDVERWSGWTSSSP